MINRHALQRCERLASIKFRETSEKIKIDDSAFSTYPCFDQ